MTYTCEKCGANFEEACGAGMRLCTLPAESGAYCNGRVTPAQTVYHDTALLAGVVMRRGATFPGGEATATLEFRSSDDRAAFAVWLEANGGRLSA